MEGHGMSCQLKCHQPMLRQEALAKAELESPPALGNRANPIHTARVNRPTIINTYIHRGTQRNAVKTG